MRRALGFLMSAVLRKFKTDQIVVWCMLIRVATIFSKVGLSFALISLLAPRELVVYGVVAAKVAFIGPFLGLEFSSYAHRLLLGAEPDKRGFFLTNAAVFQGVSSLCLTLFIGLLYYLGILESPVLVALLVGLIFAENLAHEFVKIHSTLKNPVRVALIGLFRYAIWVPPLLLKFWMTSDARSAETILSYWMMGSLVASAFALISLPREVVLSIQLREISIPWMIRGLKVCAVYLLIASMMRALTTFDRILLDKFIGDIEVAAYIAFWSIAGAWRALMDSGFMVKLTPELIESVRKGRKREALVLAKAAKLSFLKYYLIGFVLIVPASVAFLNLVGKSEYLDYWHLLPGSFLVLYIAQISTLDHVLLYGISEDKALFFIHLFSLLVFFVLMFLGVSFIGAVGAQIAMGVAFFAMGYFKKKCFLQVIERPVVGF